METHIVIADEREYSRVQALAGNMRLCCVLELDC